MSLRQVGRDEYARLRVAVEIVILADELCDLDEGLIAPAAIAWVAQRERGWKRIDLVRHLLRACTRWGSERGEV